MKIGKRRIGDGEPCYIIAEIGINHSGTLNKALQLIDAAVEAGCDAVKFQKRTPEICTPKHLWERVRDTPQGPMRYIDYRRRIEFGKKQYDVIDNYCREKGIHWFASPWDVPSVQFLERYKPVAYKVASAMLTNYEVLQAIQLTGKPVIASTAMSTLADIESALELLAPSDVALLHCVATYPSRDEDLNLRVIELLMARFPGLVIGYSGHELGLATTVAAVVLGAKIVERHITLNRASWGSDQAASVEPVGFKRLVRDIRAVEVAMGDGKKRILPDEKKVAKKLRWHEA